MSERRIIEAKDAYCLPEDVLDTVYMAMNEDVGEIVSVFKVLADPTASEFSKPLKSRASVSVSL